MIVKNQFVPVKIAGKNMKHYKSLNYDVSYGEIIYVPVEHLTKGCNSNIKIICDNCGKEFERMYKTHLRCRQAHPNLDYCNYCSKAVLNNVSELMNNPENRIKIQKTCLEKYGYKSPSSSPIIREKIRQTSMEKFGDFSILGKNSIKRNDINEKMRNRTNEEWAKIKEKSNKTFYKNGSGKYSQQQLETYNIIKKKYDNVEFNYPLASFLLDIYLEKNNVKIDIEYDRWYWHQDKQRDIRRDMVLQRHYNVKVLRIKSGALIPSEKELFDCIDYLLYTEHRFKTITLSDWKEVAI